MFSVPGLGLRVQVLRFTYEGSGFRCWGSEFSAEGLGVKVQGLGLRV